MRWSHPGARSRHGAASGAVRPFPPQHMGEEQLLIKGIRTVGDSEYTGSCSPSVSSTPAQSPCHLQMGTARALLSLAEHSHSGTYCL